MGNYSCCQRGSLVVVLRQEHIFKQRHGVELSRQTLAGWIDLVADWLQPIYGHLHDEVFSRGYVQIDETPVRIWPRATAKPNGAISGRPTGPAGK